MGSFPSTLEEPATPLSTGGESSRALGGQTPPSVQPRARSLVIKKLTRGKLIVIGLDGAGKSTFTSQLIRVSIGDGFSNTGSSMASTTVNNAFEQSAIYPDPTSHQVTWSYRVDGDRYLQLIDHPGRREARKKWYAGLSSDDLAGAGNNSSSSENAGIGVVGGSGGGSHHALPLIAIIFVVDVSDRVRFPVVAAELARFQNLRERSSVLSRAPFFLLLNKTDRYLPLQPKQLHHGQGSQVPAATPNQQQYHQTQLREVRAELRKCVDHELKMMQRRYPDLAGSRFVGSRTLSPNQSTASPTSTRDSGLALGSSSARAQGPTCTVMNNVMDCCSQDTDSVAAVHAWIKDEVKKVLF
jgi:GTPase SAR1 family protein